MNKRVLVIILLIATILSPARAVLKEQNLDNTLSILRSELTNYRTELERQSGFMKEQQTQVVDKLFGIMSKSMNPHILDQETLKEIFEIRLVLEIGMADLLFNRITKEDIEELKDIVSNEPPATQFHLFNIEHEIAFHGKLYEITGNETMKKFQKMLLPVFDYVHNSGLLKKQPMLKMFVSHKELVQILETGTPEQFRNGMRNHLENHFARLFE